MTPNTPDKPKKKNSDRCYCEHEVWFVVTIGDGCMHVTPHPKTKADRKWIIESLKEVIKDIKPHEKE